MLHRLIELSLRYRAVVLLGTALLIVAGVLSAIRLPIDAVPDIRFTADLSHYVTS